MKIKTYGEFLRIRVLNQKELREVELLSVIENVWIEKTFFGWELHSGKESLECSSEEEASYLKVFLEAQMSSVKIPKDKEYLKSILPELEAIKKRIDGVIEHFIDTITSRKLREKIRREVLSEITDTEFDPVKWMENNLDKKKNKFTATMQHV